MSLMCGKVMVVEPTMNVFQVSPLSSEYSRDTSGALDVKDFDIDTVELSSRATKVRLSGT